MLVHSVKHSFFMSIRNGALVSLLMAIMMATYCTPFNNETIKMMVILTVLGTIVSIVPAIIFASYRALRLHWGIDELIK